MDNINKMRAATFWVLSVLSLWAFVTWMTNGGNFDISWWDPVVRFFVALAIAITTLIAGCCAYDIAK